MPVRVNVPIDCYEADSWNYALAYAAKIAADRNVAEIILLVHTRNQLEHTSLSRFLGPQVIKALGKGAIPIQSGPRLRAETMKTLRYVHAKAVIIAFYAEERMLDFIDDLTNVEGVVVVPDQLDGADAWVARWGANVHGQEAKAAAVLIDDPTFVRALETLTKIINRTTGLGNPRDKQMADGILRILRAKGHSDQTTNIKSWALRNGWTLAGATQLETLSRKIWSLKNKPSLSSIYNAHERYSDWKSDGD